MSYKFQVILRKKIEIKKNYIKISIDSPYKRLVWITQD